MQFWEKESPGAERSEDPSWWLLCWDILVDKVKEKAERRTMEERSDRDLESVRSKKNFFLVFQYSRLTMLLVLGEQQRDSGINMYVIITPPDFPPIQAAT